MDPQPGGRFEGKEENQPAGEGLKERCCGQYITELETPATTSRLRGELVVYG